MANCFGLLFNHYPLLEASQGDDCIQRARPCFQSHFKLV